MSDAFLGEVRNFSFGIVPKGWMTCQGQTLTITGNQPLYALIGTTYGGNGTTNFNLPDLQGRVTVGINPSNPDYIKGKQGGLEAVPLTSPQLPPHNHGFAGRVEAGTVGAIANNYISTSGTNATITTPQPLYAAPGTTIPLNPGSLSNTGGVNVGHANMQPFLATNFCIAITGFFPPRP